MSSEARTITSENAQQIALWCGGRLVQEEDALNPSVKTPGINVLTAEGVQRASMGDTIIHKTDGTFEIFKN
jgi:hypothetical protein